MAFVNNIETTEYQLVNLHNKTTFHHPSLTDCHEELSTDCHEELSADTQRSNILQLMENMIQQMKVVGIHVYHSAEISFLLHHLIDPNIMKKNSA